MTLMTNQLKLARFPRASGDDPASEWMRRAGGEFPPRKRG